MMRPIAAMILIALSLVLPGCSAIDKLTGQTDDTVLPGSREDAVPGRPSFPSAEERVSPGGASTGEPATASAEPSTEPAPCPVDDPACAGTSDDAFSDPQ